MCLYFGMSFELVVTSLSFLTNEINIIFNTCSFLYLYSDDFTFV